MENNKIIYESIEAEKQRIIDEFGITKEYLDNLERKTWNKVEKQKGNNEEKIKYIIKVLKNHAQLSTKENKKEKKIFISKIEIENILYEEIKNNNKPIFIDKNGNKYTHIENYFPLEGDLFYKESGVKLPSGFENYGNIKELANELKDFIHKYVDISPFFETISAYYILLTHIHDKFHTIPYLRVLGDYGIGKSRYLDVMGYLCYKAMITTGTTNAPGMFRFIDLWKGTLLVDESKTKFSGEDDDVTKIFNAGFERGRAIMRVDTNKEKQEQVGLFEPYGTKIIAARKNFNDKALESRCITEIMKDTNRKDIIITLNHNFFEEANILRNKLLKFRFDYYNKEYILLSETINKIDIENRLKQALSAFFILLNETDIYDEFVEFAKQYNNDTVNEVGSSYDGIIVRSVFSLLEKQIEGFKINVIKDIKDINVITTFNNIEKESEKRGRLKTMLSNINNINNLNYLNSNSKEFIINASDLLCYIHSNGFNTANPISVGRKLKELGFEKKRVNVSNTTVLALNLNLVHLTKLFKKYIPVDIESEEEYNIDEIVEVELEEDEKEVKNK